jgi:hypothetical protein
MTADTFLNSGFVRAGAERVVGRFARSVSIMSAPGMVVTPLRGLLRENKRFAPAEATEIVNGNRSRCTG